jgi:hypothetical protein
MIFMIPLRKELGTSTFRRVVSTEVAGKVAQGK